MYFFAVPYDGEITLSAEHTQTQWSAFPAAYGLVYWHDQKTALWELDQRLKRGNLIRTSPPSRE
jgi:dATP pyrophosphohydrolase